MAQDDIPAKRGRGAPKGNKNNLKHGARAEPPALQLNATTQAIYDTLAEAAPVRESGELPRADHYAVVLLARTLCRLQSLGTWLDKHGMWDRRGHLRSAARWEDKLMARAESQMASLGMTPTSRAKLGVDLKRIDLATAMSEKDPKRRAEMMREAGFVDGDAEEVTDD